LGEREGHADTTDGELPRALTTSKKYAVASTQVSAQIAAPIVIVRMTMTSRDAAVGVVHALGHRIAHTIASVRDPHPRVSGDGRAVLRDLR